jgi:hypothetical protein
VVRVLLRRIGRRRAYLCPAPVHRTAGPSRLTGSRPAAFTTGLKAGNGSMSWTATVTVAGELITHASDKSGDINRRDVQVGPGPNTFTVPQPLSQIDDIGGVLYVGSHSYSCSVAPRR